MRDIGIRLVVDDSQKSKFAGFATAAQKATDDLNSRFANPLAQYDYALNRAGASMANIGRRIFTDVTAGAVGMTVAMGGLGKVLIDVNERFSQLQITMASSLRSFQSARQVVKEVMAISAQSAVPYSALANAANVMASSPQMSGLLQKQLNTNQMSNPNGELQRYLNLIQAMQIYRPDRTPDQAIFSVRAAMGNQWRSMARVYNMSQRDMSQISGVSESDMRRNPGDRLSAIEKTFGNIVSPEATVAYSRQPTPLLENIKEMGIDRPLRMIGEGAQGSPDSPYNQILIKFQTMFDSLTKFMASTFEDKFAPRMRDAVSKAFDSLFNSGQGILAQVLDAGGIAGKGSGVERVAEGITTAVEKILKMITDIVSLFEQGNGVSKIIDFVATMSDLVKRFVKFFLVDVENALSPISFNGVGLLAMFSSGAIMSNMGTILRFFSTSLPTTMMNLFKLVTGAEAGKFTSSFSGVSSVLSRGSARGSNPFDTPIWASATPQPLKGLDYQAYKAALLQNPVMAGLLNEKLLGVPKTRAGLVTGNFVRSQYSSDQEYMQDPTNRGVLDQLRRNGMGGNNMAGIGFAADQEERFAPPPTTFASTVKKVGGNFLKAAGGVVAGAAIAFATTEAISLVIQGLGAVHEALTANTNAVTENTARREAAVNDLIATTLHDPDLQASAKTAGVDVRSLMGGGAFKSKADTLNQMKEIASRFGQDPTANTSLSKAFSDIGFTSAGMDGGFTGIQQNLDLAEKARKEIDATAAKGVGFQNFDAIIDASKDILKLNDANVATFKKIAVDRPQEAVRIYKKLISQMDGGLSAFIQAVNDQYTELGKDPLEEGRKLNLKKYGSFGDLVNRVNAKTANPSDQNEVLGGLFRSVTKGTSVESLLSGAHPSDQLSTHPLAAKVSGELDTNYDKTFWAKDAAKQLADLSKLRDTMSEQAGDLMKGFQDASSNIDKFIKDYLAQNPEGPLSDTLRGIQSDPTKFAGVENTLKQSMTVMGKNGVVLTTALGVYYDVLQKLSKEGEKLTSDDLALLQSSGLLDQLAKFGIDTTGLVAVDKTGKGKLGKLESKAGSTSSIISSITNTLKNVNPTTDDGTQIVDMIKSLLPGLNEGLKGDNIKIADKQAAMLNGLGNSRILSRSRFGRTLKSSSTSAGGEGFDSAADLQKFVESLGYNISDDSAAAKSNLFPVTQGFDAQTSITNALKIQKHIMDDMKVSQDTRNESQKTYNALLEQQAELMAKMDPKSWFDGMKEGMSTAVDQLHDFAQMGIDMGRDIKEGLGGALADIATSAKSVGGAFQEMASSILKAMSRILAQKAAETLLNFIFSAFTGSPSGLGSDQVGNSLSGAHFAIGGTVTGGTGTRDDVPAMLTNGEYVLNRHTAQRIGYHTLDMMNAGTMSHFAIGGMVGNMVGSGAGNGITASAYRNVSINITVNNNGQNRQTSTDGGDQDKTMRDLADGINALVDDKLQKAMRPGGMFRPTNPVS